MTNLELVEKYAEAWQKMDVDIIAPYLDESFKYSSFFVFETLNRSRYIEYLRGKFDAIKRDHNIPVVSVGKDRRGEPCILLHQDGNDPACITVEICNGKIVEGYMVPYSIVR